MVEIVAIVNRSRASATKKELARAGCAGYSQFSVLGRGRQRGLRMQHGQEGIPFLPKVFFSLVVESEAAQEVIEAIIRANQTGQFGDGKIFIFELDEVYRISTAGVFNEVHQSHRSS